MTDGTVTLNASTVKTRYGSTDEEITANTGTVSVNVASNAVTLGALDAGDEFTVDSTFMTIADLPSEAMRGLIENPVNPFTGNPINEDAKNEEEQYVMLTDWRIAENHGNLFTDPVRLVLKNQNLFDVSNWEVP